MHVYYSKWSDVSDKSLRGVGVQAGDTAKLDEDWLQRLEETRIKQHMLPLSSSSSTVNGST